MSQHVSEIEQEVRQPTPRRVAPDVLGYREGRSGIWCGLLYVAVISVVLLPHRLLGAPGAHAFADLKTAQDVKQELVALKERGVIVRGTARSTAAEVFNEQYMVHQIEVSTQYSYPGGGGSVTSREVSPKTTTVFGDTGHHATADVLRGLNRYKPEPIDVIHLPDQPAIHRLAGRLDAELSDATKYVGELKGALKKRNVRGERFSGADSLDEPGWYMLIVGLIQMLHWRDDHLFRSPMRRHHNLAQNGSAVPATITRIERTERLPRFRPGMTSIKRFSRKWIWSPTIASNRLTAQRHTGALALRALDEEDLFPVGSKVTVLYAPADPDDFVLYRNLSGVKVLATSPEK